MRKGRIFKNRYLLGTVLGGAMLLFAATDGYTQDGKTLQPVGNWAVSKLASSSSTGQDYCAMARRHDQNTILTFAQNAGDKSSLAVDLQKNVLDRSKSYDVTLKAGSFETRKQTLRPVSQTAFVLKLGRDPVFYDALKNSELLTVSVDDMTYQFNMKDYANGQEELNSCIASLEAPSQQVASSSSAAKSSSSSSVSPAATQSRSNYVDPGIVDSLRQENARLRTALEQERREFETQYMEQSSTSRVSELNEKIELLEKQNSNLQKRLASIGKAGEAVSNADMEKSEAELIALKQENQTYKQRVTELESKIQKMVAAGPADGGPQDITAGADAAQSQQFAAMSAQIEKMQTALAERDNEIASLQTELQTAPSDVPRAPGDAGQYQQQVLDLKAQLKQKEEELWKANSKLLASGAKGGKAAAGAMVPNAPAVSDAEVQQYQNRIASLEKALQDASKGNGADVANYQNQITSLQTAMSEKDKAIADLNEKLLMAQNDNSAAEGAQQGQIESLQAAIQEKDTQIAALNEQLSGSADKAEAVAAKDEQIRSLNEDLINTQQLIQTMESDYQARLADMQTRLDSQSLQLEAAEQERLDMAKSAESGDKQIIKELELQLTNLKLENNRLREENQSTIDENVAANALESLTDFKSIEAELSSVMRERNELAARVEELESAQRGKREEVASTNWDLQTATTRFSEAERQIKRLGQQLEQSRLQCDIEKKDLEYKLFDPKVANTEQTVKLITLEKELASAKEALRANDDRYKQQIADLENELRSKNAAPAISPQAQAQISSLQKQLDSAQAMLAQQDKQYKQQLAALEQRAASRPVARAASPQPAVSRRAVQEQRVSSNPVSLAPTPAPVTSQNISTRPQQQQSYDDFASAAAFSKLLQNNGVNLSSPVQSRAGGSGQVMRYSWKTGQIQGAAEQHSIDSPSQYQNVLNAYLNTQKSQCRGDFAAVPVADEKSGTMRVSSYDLACVGAGRDSTSSVVFYNTEDMFTSISHDAGLDNMDVAMDVRDRIASGVLQGRIAY